MSLEFQGDVVSSILEQIKEHEMARPHFQDPDVHKRTDVPRPYYFIRPSVRVLGQEKPDRPVWRLGYCDETTLTEAKKQKAKLMQPINHGSMLLKAQVPLKDVCEKFLKIYAPTIGTATRDKYTNAIERHIVPGLGSLWLGDLDVPHIQEWLNGKEVDGLGWHYRKDLKATLSSVIERARAWKLWEGDNPTKGCKVKGRPARKQTVPSVEKLGEFIGAIKNTKVLPVAQARLMVIIAVVTGLRVSEILGLKVDDLDHKEQTIRVDERYRRGEMAETKTRGSERTMPVKELMSDLAILAMGKQPGDLLFQRDGVGKDDRDIQQHILVPAAEKVGIYFKGFGMHTFRRLYINLVQEAGAHPIEAMKSAGHSSVDMTLLYTCLNADRQRTQAGKILKQVKESVQ